MAHFRTTVPTAADPQTTLDHFADFRTLPDWDPGVESAVRVDSGPLRVGSAFDVVTANGPFRVPLRYRVVEIDPGRHVALEAVGNGLRSYDVISVAESEDGTELTYDATLTLGGWRKPAEPFLAAMFRVIAGRAEKGLRRAAADLGSAREDVVETLEVSV